MSDMSSVLERQERETRERRRRRAEGKRVQKELDQQVVIAVTLLDEENQGRSHGSQVGRSPNVDKHRHSREEPALRQALSNLIESALLHIHTGGKIEIVSTGAPTGGALVVIDDDGPDMHYMVIVSNLELSSIYK
ncbi:hypothetical protein L3X38_002420 [Prunus dulcis]|uniref:Uncharacterized protein n=1 Tax=Prunus dulcis TaxID=3755 RepID=A0AAD4WXY1_PRUDU|nr:hypothetical protein L3X38_002420 [Prunus dulcis]